MVPVFHHFGVKDLHCTLDQFILFKLADHLHPRQVWTFNFVVPAFFCMQKKLDPRRTSGDLMQGRFERLESVRAAKVFENVRFRKRNGHSSASLELQFVMLGSHFHRHAPALFGGLLPDLHQIRRVQLQYRRNLVDFARRRVGSRSVLGG